MRILFLNQFYWPDSAATAQLLTDLAEHLAGSTRCTVDVIAARQSYATGRGLLPTHETRRGVHIHRVDAPVARYTRASSRATPIRRIADMAAFNTLALARALSLPRPDVCVAMTSPPLVAAVGLALRRLRSTRLMIWLMDVYPDVATALGALRPASIGHRMAERLSRCVYQHADRIVTPDRAMFAPLQRLGADPHKLTVVPNWAPNERPPIQSDDRRTDTLHVMYSGNLGLAHEFDTVLDAASRLRQRRDLRFVFAGHGAQLGRVKSEVRRRGLGNITFAPPQPLAALPEFLASGDVHLVTLRERAEGLVVPSKLYGILAAGRPTLFVGPGNNEVAHTLSAARAGWTIAPGRPGELAGHIERLATDPALLARMGRSARQYYDAHCTRSRRCQTLEHIITQLAAPVSPAR